MPDSSNAFSSLAALGFSVFPVRKGMKVPVGKWTEYQSRLATPDEIAVWDAADFNVGVVCGSVSNLFVVDVDSEEGQTFYDSFAPPLTPTVRTSKGRHFYFRYPKGLRNRVRVGDVPLDVRGEGGFVVGPGSLHPSGEAYEWQFSPEDVAFADLPSDLLALFSAPGSGVARPTAIAIQSGRKTSENRFANWIENKLTEGLGHLRAAKEGQRNDTLNNVAFALASCVAAAKLDWEPFAAELSKAAQAIGLSVAEGTIPQRARAEEGDLIEAVQNRLKAPAAGECIGRSLVDCISFLASRMPVTSSSTKPFLTLVGANSFEPSADNPGAVDLQVIVPGEGSRNLAKTSGPGDRSAVFDVVGLHIFTKSGRVISVELSGRFPILASDPDQYAGTGFASFMGEVFPQCAGPDEMSFYRAVWENLVKSAVASPDNGRWHFTETGVAKGYSSLGTGTLCGLSASAYAGVSQGFTDGGRRSDWAATTLTLSQ